MIELLLFKANISLTAMNDELRYFKLKKKCIEIHNNFYFT